ncbi:MAG: hypothetical protein STSR0003_24910 [Smithella sp.]|jgi:hypothetical protein
MDNELYKIEGDWGDKHIEIDNPGAEKAIGIGIAVAIVAVGIGWAISKIFKKTKEEE